MNNYTEKKCCEHYNGKKDITNSCIFCKTYIPRNTDKRLEEVERIASEHFDYWTEYKGKNTKVINLDAREAVKDFLSTSIAQAEQEMIKRQIDDLNGLLETHRSNKFFTGDIEIIRNKMIKDYGKIYSKINNKNK